MATSGSGSGNISSIGRICEWSLATSSVGILEELQGTALHSVSSGSGRWMIPSKDPMTRFLTHLPLQVPAAMAAIVPEQVLSS